MKKAQGIYDRAKETRCILEEISTMLCEFKSEITGHQTPSGEKTQPATCFKDEMACVVSLAVAIRGDLSRLMKEFR
jgi:hypothetical protein